MGSQVRGDDWSDAIRRVENAGRDGRLSAGAVRN
ncbi:MAG: hypothetical protein RLY70_3457, partial [Planctomycetota bacterium]